MDGITVTISASVVSAIIGAIVAYWKTKQPIKAELKQPLDVDIVDKFATREQLHAFSERLDSFVTKDELNALRGEMYTVREQLKVNDCRDEDRIRGVHKRIDELMRIMLDNKKR